MSNESDPNPNAPYAPPTTLGIPVQQPAQPFAPSSVTGKRRKGLIIAGIVVLLAGLGGAVATFVAAGSAYDEGVEDLARAPVGCTTRLDFDKAGTFTIYVETKGSTGDPGGDCPNNDRDFERDSDELPDVDLVLVDEDGNEIDTDRDDGRSYDAAGSMGQSISSVQIDDPGRFELTVTSDEDDFAIAVGKNPKEASDTLKVISYVVAGVGVVLGGLLILLGLRRRAAPPTSGRGAPITYYPEPQPPTAYAPTGAHTPPPPPPFGGGFGPPPSTPPSPPYPPTQPMPAPHWPAPPTN